MTRKMKENERKVHCSIAFDPDVMRRLNAEAKTMRVSRSLWVNLAVDVALSNEENRRDKHITNIERLLD